MHSRNLALVRLGEELLQRRYEFVTVTPATHRRVLARAFDWENADEASRLRQVFGYSRGFQAGQLPRSCLDLLAQAECLEEQGPNLRSRVRFSSLNGKLYVHSSYPTSEAGAVFFGPDTYRFCAALERYCPSVNRLVDVGCGSGAGGLSVAARARSVVLTDINARALELSGVNAALAGLAAELVESDALSNVTGEFDAVIANPPYLLDPEHRLYRDGGGSLGEALSVRIVREGLARLGAGGTLIMYTGAPIVDGKDQFWHAARPLVEAAGARIRYTELDPDVFGEELDHPSYQHVERIAVTLLVARIP